MTLEPELICSQCGQLEAQAVGDEVLCAACCHERGSCGATGEPADSGEQLFVESYSLLGRSDPNN